VDDSTNVSVLVYDVKGATISDATVTLKYRLDTGQDEVNVDKETYTTDAKGQATAVFKVSAAGAYTIKATASKSGYKDGYQSSMVTVSN
jgi:hypothetical protein